MKTSTYKQSQNVMQKQTSTKGLKNKSEASEGLRALFEVELKYIYWAEKALTKAIPEMIKKAISEELVEALIGHLKVTIEQVFRLEEVFASLGTEPIAKKCEAIAGLIKKAEKIILETEKGVVRDVGIILAGQKVEHYKIVTYGTLVAFAKTLGEDEAAALLIETLNEEKQAEEALSGIAETINVEAFFEDDENDGSNLIAANAKIKSITN